MVLLSSFQASKLKERFQRLCLLASFFPGESRPASILQKDDNGTEEEINLCMSKMNRWDNVILAKQNKLQTLPSTKNTSHS